MMRKNGLLLLILLFTLAMLGAVCWSVTVQQRDISQLQFEVRGISLTPYYDGENDSYSLFLPSFAGKEEFSAVHAGLGKLTFSHGQQVYTQLNQAPVEQDITMTVSFPWGAEDSYSLRVLQCSAYQTICIETKDGTMAMIDEDQSKQASVSVTILDESGAAQYQGHADISGRGNGTWYWPKKPYDLKFPETITACGFEGIDKLCLLAEYNDHSKLRNGLALHTGTLLQIPYASGYTYADVYIDGVYNGIYGLATKREYTKHISSDGIGAVFELSSSNKGDYFYTDHHKQIRIHYGTQEPILYHVEAFENALLDRDWDTLWQTADLESWARKYALDEFYYNYDLPLTSQYFYLDGDGKIKCMLPWDYEWVFYARMSPYDFNEERALAAYYSTGNWYEILLECEQFRMAVAKVLREEFTEELFVTLENYLQSGIRELTGSWHCDYYRWDSGYARKPVTDGGLATMDRLFKVYQGNFRSRRAFLLALLENWEEHHLVLFFTETDGQRSQSSLQLILPEGADLTQYRQQILDTLTNLGGQPPLSCTAQDGRALDAITAVTEDLAFTVLYES